MTNNKIKIRRFPKVEMNRSTRIVMTAMEILDLLNGKNTQESAEALKEVIKWFEGWELGEYATEYIKKHIAIEVHHLLLGKDRKESLEALKEVIKWFEEMKKDIPDDTPMSERETLRNIAKCRKCGDVIESLHRHDFKSCKCRAISVDGGRDYFKRSGNPEDFEDMSGMGISNILFLRDPQ